MDITYYKKSEESGLLIATFGVYIPQWNMEISNLAILKSKQGGWFITMPTYKDKETGAWEKVIRFEGEAQQRFIKTARSAVEEYAKKAQEVIA